MDHLAELSGQLAQALRHRLGGDGIDESSGCRLQLVKVTLRSLFAAWVVWEKMV